MNPGYSVKEKINTLYLRLQLKFLWSLTNTLASHSEVGSSNPRPYVRKLVVAYRRSAVYSIEP